MNEVSNELAEFLDETKAFFEMLDHVAFATIVELYQMYEVCAANACANITCIDTELRVEIGRRLDALLDYIAMIPDFDIKVTANVYTPAIQGYRKWKNVELMKDKGLVGYMLGKEIGAQPTMYYCSKTDNYTYLSELDGLELLYLDTQVDEADPYYAFLIQNYRQMDILILHGMYDETIAYLDAYRKLRPDGKVYCGLDMNKQWMEKIDWESQAVKNFAKQCDIIATSCTRLRDALNRNAKVPFTCRYLPNGFYNAGIDVVADEAIKQNTIITVGRIGTLQKNNMELMRGFAKIAHLLPEWKLKFIGPIEESFRATIDTYYASNPHLKEQVIFTGPITDKDTLYGEYAKAKIFALTSLAEGGTPNVYAEALHHGCMFITSSIDAADDITHFGALGSTYKLGDIEQLAQTLLTLCKKADASHYQKHIESATTYAKKHFDWETNARKLAYALFPV